LPEVIELTDFKIIRRTVLTYDGTCALANQWALVVIIRKQPDHDGPPMNAETIILIAEAVAAAIQQTSRTTDVALGQLPKTKLLTVKQTIAYLNTSRPSLYRMEQQGVLLPMRFGRKVLYEVAELDAHIARAGQTRR
jgi:excisionase family DNA binding protein